MQGGKPRSGSFETRKSSPRTLGDRHFVILLLENVILMDRRCVSATVLCFTMDARGVFFQEAGSKGGGAALT
jgi:hypothetical protein